MEKESGITKESFVFFSLGGAREIGLNCFVYGYKGKWLVIDCGIGFPDDGLPGVDALLPNVDFLEQEKENIVGLIITHAHEDHIGALGYLWPKLKCPVYLTPFANELLEYKLSETGLLGKVPLYIHDVSSQLELDPFTIDVFPVAHSIPEATGLAITTDKGTVVHSGDWKWEKKPLLGKEMDFAKLTALGKKGVLAFVSDSTNVSGTESDLTEKDVREKLTQLLCGLNQQIFITCFASNITRLKSIYEAAVNAEKEVCLMGKSLWRMDAVARATGYFDGIPEFLSEEEAMDKPKGAVVYVCTGCQGETFSALNNLFNTKGKFDGVCLEPGDTVIFSSRVIPGNEKKIAYLQKKLQAKGVFIITDEQENVHVSGHYAGDDLKKMYVLLKPKIALPVHGDVLDIGMHINVAQEMGVPFAFSLEEGQVLSLDPENPEIVDQVKTSVLALDGKKIIPLNASVIKKRKQMLEGRTIVLTVVLDKECNVLGEPQISDFGLIDDTSEEMQEFKNYLHEQITALEDNIKTKDEALKSNIINLVRIWIKERYGKKALVQIHLVRI